MNRRIQRKRTKGWRMPQNAVYVGRGSKYGNPYKVIRVRGWYRIENQLNNQLSGLLFRDERRAVKRACNLYEFYLQRKYQDKAALDEFLSPLKGKDLACWCSLDKQCHADVLLRMLGE